jgi:glycosyltransferase involved in cell wall biosynthesis
MFKLSIVVISKGDPEGLRNTLESIPISVNNEIIVVSGNNSPIEKEIRVYSKHPEMIVLEGPDFGIYPAMNRGIYAARGKFIWFLNSGDVSLLQKKSDLEKLTRRVKKAKWLIALQKPKSKFPVVSLACSRFMLLSGIKPIPHQSTIFDRETLLSIGGYNEEFRIEADQELFLRLYKLKLKPSLWIRNISQHQSGGIGDLQKRGTFQDQIIELKSNLEISDNENSRIAKILRAIQKALWMKQ